MNLENFGIQALSDISITIPSTRQLKKKENWVYDSQTKEYSIRRYNYLLKKRILPETRYGQIFCQVEAESVPGKIMKACAQTVEVININESIKQKLRELSLSPQLDLRLLPFVNPALAANLRCSITATINEKRQERTQKTLEDTIEFNIPSILKEKRIHPAVYQKYAIDINLAVVDYLKVTYKKGFLGFMEKRKKEPEFLLNQQVQKNFEIYDMPICTIYYWHLLPQSFVLVTESKYESSLLEDPCEIEILPPQRPKPTYIREPFKPTLYKISNAAFPLKKSDLTCVEDELNDES